MADVHFGYTFITVDSSVVPDTLIDLFLYVTTCSRNPPRKCIIIILKRSFESFQILVNFFLSHTVVTMLNGYSTVKFTNFYTPCQQKLDHKSLMFFAAFQQTKGCVSVKFCVRMCKLCSCYSSILEILFICITFLS